jgi:hypothetical protein
LKNFEARQIRPLALALLAGLAVNACAAPVAPGDEEDNEALQASGRCGVERWSIKTGTDAAASTVNMAAQDTTIAALRAAPVPAGNASSSARHAGTPETQLWLLAATLVQYKVENDSDYHLEIKDAAGATMIAEIPAPSCVSGGPWLSGITAARAAMDAKYMVGGSFQAANVPVVLTGVGFFDLLHGQTGVAPNGIELHAVLSICFPGSTVSGCGSSQDFSVSVNPASLTTAQGASGTANVAVTGSNGFSSNVTLAVSGLPGGASTSFANGSVAPGSSTALTLNAGSAAAGTYALTVAGTSGTVSHTTALTWTISGPVTTPGFTLTASPAQVSTTEGSSGTAVISVNGVNGFSGNVALSVSGAPAGASASVGASSIAAGGSTVLTLSSGTAAAGAYSIRVTGTSGALVQTASIGWTISGAVGGSVIVNGDFEIGDLSGWTITGTASNTATTPHGGLHAAQVGSKTSTGPSTIAQTFTVPAGGGPLTFWYQGICNDTVKYAWASATLVDNTSAASTALLANTCTKTGQWVKVTSGALPVGHSMTVKLLSQGEVYQTSYNYTLFDDIQVSGGVTPPPTADFSLTAAAASVTTQPAGTGVDAITVAGNNGFTGTVALTASGLPSGASASFSPGSITSAGNATLSLSAGSAAAGTYAVSITGTAGQLIHSAPVSWSISSTTPPPDFNVTSNASAVTSNNGAAATDSLTLLASNGFNNSVALSVGGLPAGASSAFTPASVAGGSGNATLSLTPGTAAPGSYPLAITGTGGGKSHTAALTWTIGTSAPKPFIQNVFIILLENHNWSQISGSSSAPYINNTLLTQGAHAENYNNVPGIHPSLPNYLWLEAGTNFGILSDGLPSSLHQSSTQHLVTLLQNAGVSWRAYQEGISGTTCPLTVTGLYAPKHNPMVFFDDVTNSNNASSANCISHERPYTQLATDLSSNQVARYNFITPNLCDDGHNPSGCSSTDEVKNTDNWLAANVPAILNSAAYKNGGALFITWDESEGGDHPIGMMVMSPHAKAGYASHVSLSHSSTLRTMEEIFSVGPFLGDAANANDLSDLFTSFP